jgi:hypothetical protein
LDHQILTEQLPKGNQIVDKKAGGGKDQSDATRQHRNQRELPLDG